MKSHEIFGDFENKTNTIVDQKSQTLKDIFDGVKAKVDSAVPGGIPAIERLKGASINDISGYS